MHRAADCILDRVAIRPREIPSATRSRTPPGCRSKVGGREPGVFASLDPRLMSVTPIGVGSATASPGCHWAATGVDAWAIRWRGGLAEVDSSAGLEP